MRKLFARWSCRAKIYGRIERRITQILSCLIRAVMGRDLFRRINVNNEKIDEIRIYDI